jgi:hypothetical protein
MILRNDRHRGQDRCRQLSWLGFLLTAGPYPHARDSGKWKFEVTLCRGPGARALRTPPAALGPGLSVFDLIRNYHHGSTATLYAFDLIEIDGQDMTQQPIEDRKAELKQLLSKSHPAIAYNRHFDVEGAIVFHHTCKLGC